MRFLRRAVQCGCIFAATSAMDIARAQPVAIEGDKALLELVYAAQLTNKTKYEQGRLTAKARAVHRGGKIRSAVDVQAAVVWRRDGTYWSYSASENYSQGRTIEERREQIETAAMIVNFAREQKLMTLAKPAERSISYREELKLRPDQQWFRWDANFEWTDFLEHDRQNPRIPAKAFVVSKKGDDRIIIERRYTVDATLQIVASFAADANIIEYESEAEKGKQWQHGTYTWERNDDGDLYLKHHQRETTYLGNRRKPEITFAMDVSEFKLNPEISADRFDLSSLNAPPDTIVEEIGPGGARSRRRLGGNRPRDLQGELDAAAKKVRSGKFASPEKGR